MSLVARSKEKWLFSEATQTAVQNEREGDVNPSGQVCEEINLFSLKRLHSVFLQNIQ